MSPSPGPQLLRFLEERRARFTAQLPDRLAGIEGEWLALERTPHDEDAAQRLSIAAHSLAGTAPMFGFPVLGEAARDVHRQAEAIAAGRFSDEGRDALARAMSRLHAAVRP